MRQDINRKLKLITIENTYILKDIDVAKIFEKDYSTKNRNSGIGLWEVSQILKKSHNVNLLTTKDEKYFKQTIEIYC